MTDSRPGATYVVMISDRPDAAATTLQGALDNALHERSRYLPATDYEYRWDEYAPDVWRLMSRQRGRKGRYSWTQYAVHAVPTVGPVTGEHAEGAQR